MVKIYLQITTQHCTDESVCTGNHILTNTDKVMLISHIVVHHEYDKKYVICQSTYKNHHTDANVHPIRPNSLIHQHCKISGIICLLALFKIINVYLLNDNSKCTIVFTFLLLKIVKANTTVSFHIPFNCFV